MSKHDIMAGSPGWQRISEGVPAGITDPDTRAMLHAYAQVTTILVGQVNMALDEIDTLHQRIDRRGDAHEALKDKLFDPDEGSFAKEKARVDAKFGKFTGPVFLLIGSVMSGLILLAAQRITGGA